MKFETLLNFLISHNEAIIQWTMSVIIGSSAWLFFRVIFGKKTPVVPVAMATVDGSKLASEASLTEVATNIQKLLMQTSTVEKTVVAPAAEGSSIDPAEIARLKKTLQDREDELARAKSDPLNEKYKSQQARVEELESKLGEYEILEDDIADLSLYKDENARLKSELEKFKGKVPQTAEGIVKEFADVVEATKGAESSGAELATLEKTDDVMADFAQAMEVQKPAPVAAPEPATAASVAAPAPALAVVPNPVEDGAPSATADLFAEFSGNLDTDRVMEELASLEKIQGEGGKEALEEQLDTDKMVAQAAGFSKK